MAIDYIRTVHSHCLGLVPYGRKLIRETRGLVPAILRRLFIFAEKYPCKDIACSFDGRCYPAFFYDWRTLSETFGNSNQDDLKNAINAMAFANVISGYELSEAPRYKSYCWAEKNRPEWRPSLISILIPREYRCWSDPAT